MVVGFFACPSVSLFHTHLFPPQLSTRLDATLAFDLLADILCIADLVVNTRGTQQGCFWLLLCWFPHHCFLSTDEMVACLFHLRLKSGSIICLRFGILLFVCLTDCVHFPYFRSCLLRGRCVDHLSEEDPYALPARCCVLSQVIFCHFLAYLRFSFRV